ncbi:MAG: TonB-dependent receptor plug domain-containing protein [Deltaproteobacteria bacterium]
MKSIYILSFITILSQQLLFSQNSTTDSTKNITLNEIVVSANKMSETKKNVAQQIKVISSSEISTVNSQTTADLLQNTANVFVQKSQQGGGSPVLRGFEASRILLVVDGVRMNNIIYRSGHLQNIITLDNSSLDRVEVLQGPASTIYGSDALGGVIHFITRKPEFAYDKKIFKLNFASRFGSVNNELSGHLDFNYGTSKLSALTSVTYSKFGDLKGGENQNPFYTKSYGERPFYVERIDGKDVMVKNENKFLQVQSGYKQYDIMQKFAFRQNDHIVHSLNLQFSNSSDIPRYDRLTEYSGSNLSSAQWYYGPQKRLMGSYNFDVKNPDGMFQDIHFGLNYQNIEESRHTRRFGKSNLSHRIENVNVIGANLDLTKAFNFNTIHFGIDLQYNTLKSKATSENIVTGESAKLDTRYPDGDNNLIDFSAYYSHTLKLKNNFTLIDGIRIGYSSLHSTIIDNSFFKLPVTEINQNTPVFSGNLGLINVPTDDLKVSLLFSTGYRVANIDDLSKIFETVKGKVIVPNTELKPEKTLNYEVGLTKIFSGTTKLESSIYYTQFIDAIVTEKFTLNGQDSIVYDGVKSQVYANQNKRKAYIYGFSSELSSQLSDFLRIGAMVNYTYGRIKTDTTDYPLDHVSPFLASMKLSYDNKKFSSEFFINYNGWKRLKDYNPDGEDNIQYATSEGMPAWLTANVNFSYKVHKNVRLQFGIYNIFDTQYRVFASGINAPGRNIFGTLRINI